MDMPYATIPIFNEKRRLHRENRLAYMISSRDNPENHPFFAVDIDLGSAILYNDLYFEEIDKQEIQIHKEERNH
jgi:hypothetical protein